MEGQPKTPQETGARIENSERSLEWRELKDQAETMARAALQEMVRTDLDAPAGPEKFAAMQEALDILSETDPDTGFPLHNEQRFAAGLIAERLAEEETEYEEAVAAAAEANAVPMPKTPPVYAQTV